MQPMTPIATLHPPRNPPRPRRERPAFDLATLSALVLEDDGARLLRATPDRIEIAIDVGTGQNLAVTLLAGELRVEAARTGGERKYDEEHGEWLDDDDDDDDLEEAAGALVERVQAATGWHVESDRLAGFDPGGACPHCQLECFEWQERCSACDADLEPSEKSPDDDSDRHAARLLRGLLAESLLELSSPNGSRPVQSALAAYLANGWAAPARLLALLTELREVAEVYADEADITRLLK